LVRQKRLGTVTHLPVPIRNPSWNQTQNKRGCLASGHGLRGGAPDPGPQRGR
jgi:hypothetical protein